MTALSFALRLLGLLFVSLSWYPVREHLLQMLPGLPLSLVASSARYVYLGIGVVLYASGAIVSWRQRVADDRRSKEELL